MQDSEKEILDDESAKGRRAEAAYNGFFKPFFDEKEKVLIEAFRTVSVTDSKALLNIKLQFKAIDSLHDEMMTFINTGKMASKTLTDGEENKNGD